MQNVFLVLFSMYLIFTWLLWQRYLIYAKGDYETASVSGEFLQQKSLRGPPSQRLTSFRTETGSSLRDCFFFKAKERCLVMWSGTEMALVCVWCVCMGVLLVILKGLVHLFCLWVCALKQRIRCSGPHPSPVPVLRYLPYHFVCVNVNVYSLCVNLCMLIVLNNI